MHYGTPELKDIMPPIGLFGVATEGAGAGRTVSRCPLCGQASPAGTAGDPMECGGEPMPGSDRYAFAWYFRHADSRECEVGLELMACVRLLDEDRRRTLNPGNHYGPPLDQAEVTAARGRLDEWAPRLHVIRTFLARFPAVTPSTPAQVCAHVHHSETS